MSIRPAALANGRQRGSHLVASAWKWLPSPIASLHFLLVLLFAYQTETRGIGVCLVMLLAVFLYNLCRCFHLGPRLGSFLSLSFILLIFAASKFKFWLSARRLHPFDLYIYGDIRNFDYIKDLYPTLYPYLYASMAAFLALVVTIAYFERRVGPRRGHLVAMMLSVASFVAFSGASRYLDGNGYGPGNRFLHFDHQHVSTFIIALVHAAPNLLSEPVFQYGPKQAIDMSAVKRMQHNSCQPNSVDKRPHIVTVLRESITIPARIPAMAVPNVNDDYFKSYDGMARTMRVETHGAGSAFTIFSVLTGLSAEAFGGTKILALDLMPGRIHYSIAKLMSGCGYRPIVVSSGIAGYVASEKFYRSAGFEEYYDLNALKAHSGGDITDRAIYAYLETFLRTGPDRRPVFAYVDTTASHAPYDSKLRADEEIPEANGIANREIAEYVRRLLLGERDLSQFLTRAESRAANADGRPLVVVDFGDHQPPFTKDLVGHPGYVIEDPDRDDPHLLTYFRIRSAGMKLAAIPKDHAVTDAAFLSDWLLQALGWQIDGVYRERWHMIEKCKSRYWQCDNRAAAYTLHQTMKQAGYLTF